MQFFGFASANSKSFQSLVEELFNPELAPGEGCLAHLHFLRKARLPNVMNTEKEGFAGDIATSL